MFCQVPGGKLEEKSKHAEQLQSVELTQKNKISRSEDMPSEPEHVFAVLVPSVRYAVCVEATVLLFGPSIHHIWQTETAETFGWLTMVD